jgi:rhodanese-related sulfurtransferase
MINKCHRKSGLREILLEAVLLIFVGVCLSIVANALSPRGLSLKRRLPGIAHDGKPAGVVPEMRVLTPATNIVFPTDLTALRVRANGLQAIDLTLAVQLFEDSRRQNGQVVFIDARDENHYTKGHVPGAFTFDPFQPEKYLELVLPVCRAAEQVVVYCTGGRCEDSLDASILLRDAGVPTQKILVFTGGISEWTAGGLPVEAGSRQSGDIQTVTK